MDDNLCPHCDPRYGDLRNLCPEHLLNHLQKWWGDEFNRVLAGVLTDAQTSELMRLTSISAGTYQQPGSSSEEEQPSFSDDDDNVPEHEEPSPL